MNGDGPSSGVKIVSTSPSSAAAALPACWSASSLSSTPRWDLTLVIVSGFDLQLMRVSIADGEVHCPCLCAEGRGGTADFGRKDSWVGVGLGGAVVEEDCSRTHGAASTAVARGYLILVAVPEIAILTA
eukprot:2413528-Rhodomonas_salina.1